MNNRELKISHNVKYEMELPTDDPPAVVNAVCAGDPRRVGVPNLNGFRATILDLIDRNYLFLKNRSYNRFYNSESLLLEINPNKDLSSLWKFEVMVLDFLREYEQEGIISMDLLSESMKRLTNGQFDRSEYRNLIYEYERNLYAYEDWKNEVKRTLVEGHFNEAFYSNGYNYLKIFGVLGTITAWALMFYSFPSRLFSGIFMLCALTLLISSFISLFLPQKIVGHWTPYGREYYERWMNFKRYIEDFSLIKDCSPEYVKIWNKYLVYATALGAAKGVKKIIGLSLPEDELLKSDVYMFHNYEYKNSD